MSTYEWMRQEREELLAHLEDSFRSGEIQMKKQKDEWWVMHCEKCKKIVADTQRCCHRYLCDSCHLTECAMAPKQLTIEMLRRLARNLHVALKQSLAGEEIPPERIENLDENIAVHLGPNYESVIEER